MTSLLLIFTKNPILHRVKTRLAHDIGAINALTIYRHLLTLKTCFPALTDNEQIVGTNRCDVSSHYKKIFCQEK